MNVPPPAVIDTSITTPGKTTEPEKIVKTELLTEKMTAQLFLPATEVKQPDSVPAVAKILPTKTRKYSPKLKDEKEKKSNLSSLVSVKAMIISWPPLVVYEILSYGK